MSATSCSAVGCVFRKFTTVIAALTFTVVPLCQKPVKPPPPVLIGAAWYPEQWPESRWAADVELMEKAHMHVVRVGEFAWTAMEPQEGKYELDWLERAINLAGQHGIYVILGTPTAGPPVWMATQY